MDVTVKRCVLPTTIEWQQNGILHRDDGPAVIRDWGDEDLWPSGIRGVGHVKLYDFDDEVEWWRNGNQLSFDEWLAELAAIDTDYAIRMKLIWG